MKSKKKKILLIGNNKSISLGKIKIIENEGFVFFTLNVFEEIKKAFEKKSFDLLIIDTSILDYIQLKAVLNLNLAELNLPVIFILGKSDKNLSKILNKLQPCWALDKKSDGNSYLTLIRNSIIFNDLLLKQKKNITEEILQKEKDLARSYLDIAGVMIVALNKSGKIALINKKGCQILGYSEKELINRNWVELFISESEKEEVKYVISHLLNGKVKQYEYFENSIFTKNGEKRIIAFHNSILKDKTGKITGILFSGEDITAQKQIEQDLRESEQKFHSMFEYHKAIMLLIDPSDGQIIDANRSASEFYGYTRHKLSSMKISEINALSESDVEKNVKLATHDKKSYFIFPHKLSDGQIRTVEVYSSPVKINKKKLLFSIVYDITEKKKAEEDLKLSQSNLLSLIESTNDLIWFVDKEFKVVVFNSNLANHVKQLYGKDLKQGDLPTDSLPPERSSNWIPLYSRAINEGAHKTSIELTNGRILEMFFNPVVKDKEVIGVSVFGKDITERYKSELALKESEENLRGILYASTESVLLIDNDGTVITANETAAKRFGMNRCEFTGQNIFSFIPAEIVEERKAWIEKVIQTKSPVTFDDKRGELWLENHFYPVISEGKVTKIAVYSTDVSKRKKAEEALFNSMQMLEFVLNNMPQRVFWKDKNLKFLGCNKAFALDAGFENPDEIIGKDDFQLSWKESADHFSADDNRVINTGIGKFNYEESQLYTDGSKRWLITNKIPLRNQDGEILGVLGTYEDITGRKEHEHILKDLSDRLQLALKSAQIGIWDYDIEKKLLTWDDQIYNLYGISKDNFTNGLSLWDKAVHPDDLERVRKEILDAINGIRELDIEFRIIRPENEIRLIRATAFLQKNDIGIPIRVVGLNYDITEQKLYEKEISLNEKRLNSLYKLSQMVDVNENEIIDFALEEVVNLTESFGGYLHFVNPDQKTLRLFTWSKGLKNICKVEKKEMYPISDAGIWADCFRTRKPVIHNDYQNQVGRKGYPEGHFDLVRHMSIPIFDGEQIVGIAGVGNKLTDYTDADVKQLYVYMNEMWKVINKKHAEKALTESEQKFRSIFTSANTGIVFTDINGNILFSNKVFQEIIGYSNEELKEFNFQDFSHPDDLELDLSNYKRIFTNEIEQFRIEKRYITKLKEVKWVDLSVSVIRDQDKKPVYFVGVMNDISKKIKTRDELFIAKEEAIKANKAKSSFLANMSHEIRTPMNAIIGFTDLMLSKIDDPKYKSFLTSIKTSGKALLTLINDILDLSKIEAGKMEIHANTISLSSFLEEIRQMFILKISEKKLDFLIEKQKNIPEMFLMDELRFKQVMLNLVGNAIKFTEKGFIKISVSAFAVNTENYDITVSVEDTGIGIPNEALSSIFEAFIQVENELTKKHEGTGLGLAITKKLIEMMNGTISVKSELGKGSIFSISFTNVPVIYSRPAEIEPEIAEEWENIIYDNSSVLIVDDIESNRNFLRELLSHKNLELTEAENGAEAILFAKEINPDIILMDLRMPVLDGFQAAITIRETEQTSKIPIIAISASTLSSTDFELVNQYFNGYINKPIKPITLFRQLNNYLDHSYSGKIEPITEITDIITDLNGLIDVFKKKLLPEWEKAKKTPDLKIIEEFALDAAETGKTFNCKTLINYGSELCAYAANIDIENAQKLLDNFSEIGQLLIRRTE